MILLFLTNLAMSADSLLVQSSVNLLYHLNKVKLSFIMLFLFFFVANLHNVISAMPLDLSLFIYNLLISDIFWELEKKCWYWLSTFVLYCSSVIRGLTFCSEWFIVVGDMFFEIDWSHNMCKLLSCLAREGNLL